MGQGEWEHEPAAAAAVMAARERTSRCASWQGTLHWYRCIYHNGGIGAYIVTLLSAHTSLHWYRKHATSSSLDL